MNQTTPPVGASDRDETTRSGAPGAPQQPHGPQDRERELGAEQPVVDLAYSELARQLAQARRSRAQTEARGVSGTPQSRGERDAYASHYSSQISSLEGVEDRLVFGRMDLSPEALEAGGASSSPVTDGGRRHYVGRIGLQDESHREVVLDWRAPLARAFYQATATQPMGLVRRRHIDTRARRVIGLEDELIDVGALDSLAPVGRGAAGAGLQGEGALGAAAPTSYRHPGAAGRLPGGRAHQRGRAGDAGGR